MGGVHPDLYHPEIGAYDVALDLIVLVLDLVSSGDGFSFKLRLQNVDRGLIVRQGSVWVVVGELGKIEIGGWGGYIDEGQKHLPWVRMWADQRQTPPTSLAASTSPSSSRTTPIISLA